MAAPEQQPYIPAPAFRFPQDASRPLSWSPLFLPGLPGSSEYHNNQFLVVKPRSQSPLFALTAGEINQEETPYTRSVLGPKQGVLSGGYFLTYYQDAETSSDNGYYEISVAPTFTDQTMPKNIQTLIDRLNPDAQDSLQLNLSAPLPHCIISPAGVRLIPAGPPISFVPQEPPPPLFEFSSQGWQLSPTLTKDLAEISTDGRLHKPPSTLRWFRLLVADQSIFFEVLSGKFQFMPFPPSLAQVNMWAGLAINLPTFEQVHQQLTEHIRHNSLTTQALFGMVRYFGRLADAAEEVAN